MKQPFIIRKAATQYLCIGGDNGQRCFQLMGGISNKLLLLVKSGLYRFGSPSGQEKDRNKDQDNAKESNVKADPQQPCLIRICRLRLPLAGRSRIHEIIRNIPAGFPESDTE